VVFARRLVEERQRGAFAYGALAVRLGEQLERKWLKRRQVIDKGTLEVADFAATDHLFSLASRIYDVRIVPVEFKSVGLLVLATLLPFLPIALLAVPLDVILKKAAGLLF
jgi:hypothetical protein